MTTASSRPWYSILYIQVLIAIAIGIFLGHYFPKTGVAMKPLGDGFIALIKMMIAPVIFCTVVHGISSMSDLKKVGRVGVKTLFYFEVVSSFALIIGLIVGKVVQPGAGFNIDPSTLDANAVAGYVKSASEEGIVKHLLAIIPGDSFFGALARGDLLQVLLVSILTGAGFVTLAATLAIVPDIPIQSIAILLGIDKFMSECRALTNLVGNGVATVVISRWEGELDAKKLHEVMVHPVDIGEEMEARPAE